MYSFEKKFGPYIFKKLREKKYRKRKSSERAIGTTAVATGCGGLRAAFNARATGRPGAFSFSSPFRHSAERRRRPRERRIKRSGPAAARRSLLLLRWRRRAGAQAHQPRNIRIAHSRCRPSSYRAGLGPACAERSAPSSPRRKNFVWCGKFQWLKKGIPEQLSTFMILNSCN